MAHIQGVDPHCDGCFICFPYHRFGGVPDGRGVKELYAIHLSIVILTDG